MLGGELAHRAGTRVTIGLAMAASGPLVALIPTLSAHGTFWALLLDVGLAAWSRSLPAGGVGAAGRADAGEVPRHDVSMMRTALNTAARSGRCWPPC